MSGPLAPVSEGGVQFFPSPVLLIVSSYFYDQLMPSIEPKTVSKRVAGSVGGFSLPDHPWMASTASTPR